MINEEPKRGVNEARFALTLLTCVLVAIGYIVLLRFGGVRNTSFEPGSDDPAVQIGSSAAPKETELTPRVLRVEIPDNQAERMTQRNLDPTLIHQPGNAERR